MPISATGVDVQEQVSPPPGETGFTLVELMVVIVIIGLMATAVVLNLPDSRGSLRDDSTAFAARLDTARDLSIVGGRDVAVRIDASGYGFSARGPDGWVPMVEKAMAPRQWGPGVVAAAAIEGDAGIVFDTTGLATPGQVVLRRDGATATVAIDSGGAVRVDAQ